MPDGAATTPYAELTLAIRAYGEAAMENFLRCRALGYAVAEGLGPYMKAPDGAVALVPPSGQFDPRKAYGDAAFDVDPRLPIRLEPIQFGVCVTVPNAEDSGSMWVRTQLRVEVKDDRFDVFVANQAIIRVPLAFEGQLQPVFEGVMRELMRVFRCELAEFGDARYQNQVGFVPTVVP